MPSRFRHRKRLCPAGVPALLRASVLAFTAGALAASGSFQSPAPAKAHGKSVYWARAQETHNYVAGNLLTARHGYRNHPGSTNAYEWYCVSQVNADAAVVSGGDTRYAGDMHNGFSWMQSFWDAKSAIGGYFSTVNIDGTGQGGGKYVDDHSLTGNVYLDCYAVSDGASQSNYLRSAVAVANWLIQSRLWDETYRGGFWWSDSKTVKPTQSNGLALQLFLRLYKLTGKEPYLKWANSLKSWLEAEMYDPSDGLYLWQVETNGFKNPIKFTYDNAILIEAYLLFGQVTKDKTYLAKAQRLADKLNAKLWNATHKCYYFNSADGRVNPSWCGWASQSLIKLYEADHNPAWLDYAQQTIDFMNVHLREKTNGCYYTFCNMDGSNVERRIEGVDQSWMQRLQAMMSTYR